MRKIIVLTGLALIVIGSFILLQPGSEHYTYIMRALNRDVVYFLDGSLTNIWLWDDQGVVAIGEDSDGEIRVFNKDEYEALEQNKLSQYLNLII